MNYSDLRRRTRRAYNLSLSACFSSARCSLYVSLTAFSSDLCRVESDISEIAVVTFTLN